MTDLSPTLLELKAELGDAIRQDHQRRQRRRKTIRTSVLSVGAFAALSGSALAAGDALGVIDLSGGTSAQPVTTIPVWDGTSGTFINATVGTSTTAPYGYHLTGGTTTYPCPFTNPTRYEVVPNDIYITSTRPLNAAELEQAMTANSPPSDGGGGPEPAGFVSYSSFDHPLGNGCSSNASSAPSSGTTQASPSSGTTTATQPGQTP
jgi:hypothetical protein